MATILALLWHYYVLLPPLYDTLFLVFCLVTLSIVTYRLSRALALYLKFDHALGVTLALQAIVILLLFNLWLGHTIGWRW